MKYKILLTGQKDCIEFCEKASTLTEDIKLISEKKNYCVNAKSIMGCMLASAEWGDDIYVVSDGDYYTAFEKWIDETADDGNYIHG